MQLHLKEAVKNWDKRMGRCDANPSCLTEGAANTTGKYRKSNILHYTTHSLWTEENSVSHRVLPVFHVDRYFRITESSNTFLFLILY